MHEKRPYKTKTIRLDYELWIHRIPDHVVPPFPSREEHLQETYEIWKRVVDAKVCWRVACIDAWNHIWIDVRFKNDAGELEDHSLAIYEDCFERIESGEYEVEADYFVDTDDPAT